MPVFRIKRGSFNSYDHLQKKSLTTILLLQDMPPPAFPDFGLSLMKIIYSSKTVEKSLPN